MKTGRIVVVTGAAGGWGRSSSRRRRCSPQIEPRCKLENDIMQPETRTEQRNAVGAEVRHPLSEKDGQAVAAMRKEGLPFNGKMSDPSARPPFDEVMEHTPDARGVTYEKRAVGGVPGISCTPQGARAGAAILYLHGGAYVLGSANAYRHFAGQIAARAKTTVFIAEYRLAPEHRFPAALDDAKAAYRGLVEGGARKIAIVGDSAGGGLAR